MPAPRSTPSPARLPWSSWGRPGHGRPGPRPARRSPGPAAIKVFNHGEKLPGHLPGLISHLHPAVKAANRPAGDLLENAIRENVLHNVEKLKRSGPLISKRVDQGTVRVVGGLHRLATGRVDFFAQEPESRRRRRFAGISPRLHLRPPGTRGDSGRE